VGFLETEKSSTTVEREHPLKILFRQVDQRLNHASSRIRDKDVELAKVLFYSVEQRSDIQGSRYICSVAPGIRSVLANKLESFLRRGLVPGIVDGDLRAVTREAHGDGTANSTRRSGYKCRLSLKGRSHRSIQSSLQPSGDKNMKHYAAFAIRLLDCSRILVIRWFTD
jgi:hypothetical protein